jgi:hypothetical protein
MAIKMMFGTTAVEDAVMSIRYSRLKDRIIHIAWNRDEEFKVYSEDMSTGKIKLSCEGEKAKDFVRHNFGFHGMNLLRIHSKGEFTDKEAEVVDKVFKAFSYRLKERQKGIAIPDQYIGTMPLKARNTFVEQDGEEATITIDENTFSVV